MNALNTNVLVLNSSYVPVWITTVKRAFVMLFKQQAEVVSVENKSYINYDLFSWAELSQLKRELEETTGLEDWIFSYSKVFEVPRVIRLLHFNKVPKNKVRLSRRAIFYRDNFTCQFCGKKFHSKDLNIDHVIPSSRGGKNVWTNLVCSCYKCNIKKSNRTPKEAGMKLLRKPFEPKFVPHMLINSKDKRYESWKAFLSDIYWSAELIE